MPDDDRVIGKLPILVQVIPYEITDDFRRLRRAGISGVHMLHTWGTAGRPGVSPLVGLHERQHDSRLQESTYGFLQRYFRTYAQPGVPKRWRVYGQQWSAALAGASHAAHEQSAIYLSVKQLGLEDEAAALQLLNYTYREYYHQMSSLIDRDTASTYFQYAIANAMMHLAFDSPIIHRVAHAHPSLAASVSTEESPDARLDRLKSLVNERSVASVRDAVAERVRHLASDRRWSADFEVDNELAWLSLDLEARIEMEAHLSEAIMDWFASHANAGLERSRLRELKSDADVLVQKAGKRGVVLGTIGRELFELFWSVADLDGSTIPSAMSAAESVLLNERIVDRSDVDALGHNDFWVVPRDRSKTRMVVICEAELCNPDLRHDWYVTLVTEDHLANERIVRLVGVSNRQLRQFLQQGFGQANDLYVVGLPAPDTEVGYELVAKSIDAVIAMFRDVGQPRLSTADPVSTTTHPGFERLVFYMHGNMLTWAALFQQMDGARYSAFVLSEIERPAGSSTPGKLRLGEMTKGIGVHVFMCDELPMTFVRFANSIAFSETSGRIADCARKTGRIRLDTSPDEAAQDRWVVQLTLSSVEAAWTVF